MMSASQTQLPPEVTNWLYRVLSPEYQDSNRTYSDAVQVLISYPSLRPRTSVFTDENGRPELLLCFTGTIPATIANSVYRIPVEIWVPKAYPLLPPFAFVRPTKNMLIHPGNYVDTNGKCYHPYLSYWRDNVQTSNITEFIRVMSVAFGKESPVYAKPPNYQTPPPLPPHPHTPTHDTQRDSVINAISAHNTGNSIRSGPFPSPINASLTGERVPPPRPALPSQLNHGQPPQYVPSPILPHAIPLPAPKPIVHKPLDIMDLPDNNGSSPRGSISSSSSQVVTPPRPPPNPQKLEAIEKLKTAMVDITLRHEQTMINENDVRLAQNSETLSWMENVVNTEISELQRLIVASKENEAILTSKIEQAKTVINDANSRPDPNIDDVVCAENVVYNQLYDLVTEDYAIEDTIYVLSKALENDRINLDTFLKHIRTLAREQFMKRALVEKIKNQINLA